MNIRMLGVLLLLAGTCHAATVTLTCSVVPTQYTDNTPITVPLTFKAYWGTSSTNTPNALQATTTCGGSVVVPDPMPGVSVTYYFAITAIASGVESAKSNVATKVITTPLPTPKPPSILIAEAGSQVFNTGTFDPTAWRVKRNKLYGTLITDAACDESRPAAEGYYRVPASAVRWINPRARTPYPLAKCEQS